MRALLKILYFFLTIFILLLIAGIFLPKSVKIVSSIKIYANADLVFDQVNDLKQWNKWELWFKDDSTLKVTFGEKTSGIGANYSWTSEKSGEGSFTIVESVSNTSIKTEMDIPGKGKSTSPWTFKTDGKFTQVTWGYENNGLSYMERYFVWFFSKNMTRSFDAGLTSLKKYCESLRLSRVSEIVIEQQSDLQVMAIKDSVPTEKFFETLDVVKIKMKNYLLRRHLPEIAQPLVVINQWNDTISQSFIFAQPINEKTWSWNEYQSYTLSGGRMLTLNHYGLYNSAKPFKELEIYAATNNLTIKGSPRVEYLTDIKLEADTSKWCMKVSLPIE